MTDRAVVSDWVEKISKTWSKLAGSAYSWLMMHAEEKAE